MMIRSATALRNDYDGMVKLSTEKQEPIYLTRNGEIHRGRPLEKIGAHCLNHNRHSIGICYEGGLDAASFPADTRTLEQKASLLALLRELKRIFPRALIVGHHDLNPAKACPCFDAEREYRGL